MGKAVASKLTIGDRFKPNAFLHLNNVTNALILNFSEVSVTDFALFMALPGIKNYGGTE
jgi:hypothetical protein